MHVNLVLLAYMFLKNVVDTGVRIRFVIVVQVHVCCHCIRDCLVSQLVNTDIHGFNHNISDTFYCWIEFDMVSMQHLKYRTLWDLEELGQLTLLR